MAAGAVATATVLSARIMSSKGRGQASAGAAPGASMNRTLGTAFMVEMPSFLGAKAALD